MVPGVAVELCCCGKVFRVTFKDGGKCILCDPAIYQVYSKVVVFRKSKLGRKLFYAAQSGYWA